MSPGESGSEGWFRVALSERDRALERAQCDAGCDREIAQDGIVITGVVEEVLIHDQSAEVPIGLELGVDGGFSGSFVEVSQFADESLELLLGHGFLRGSHERLIFAQNGRIATPGVAIR